MQVLHHLVFFILFAEFPQFSNIPLPVHLHGIPGHRVRLPSAPLPRHQWSHASKSKTTLQSLVLFSLSCGSYLGGRTRLEYDRILFRCDGLFRPCSSVFRALGLKCSHPKILSLIGPFDQILFLDVTYQKENETEGQNSRTLCHCVFVATPQTWMMFQSIKSRLWKQQAGGFSSVPWIRRCLADGSDFVCFCRTASACSLMRWGLLTRTLQRPGRSRSSGPPSSSCAVSRHGSCSFTLLLSLPLVQ